MKIVGYIAVIVMLVAMSGDGKAQNFNKNTVEVSALLTSDNDDTDIFVGQMTDHKSDKKKKGDVGSSKLDTDGDGVPDDDDLCPYVEGSKKARGCPDKDDDGVPDFMDDCPDTPGLTELKGCPDSDGDGIPDHKDDCPNEKGSASNRGCPFQRNTADTNTKPQAPETTINNKPDNEVRVISPRRDVFDEGEYAQDEPIKDRNYYVELSKKLELEAQIAAAKNESSKAAILSVASAGTNTTVEQLANNIPSATNGTKVAEPIAKVVAYKLWKVSQRDIILSGEEIKLIEDVFNNQTFVYGRNIIENNSYNLLNQFTDLLNKKYSWKIVLHCYTDEADNPFRNQQLSSNRGEALRSYFMSKGINHSRIIVKGYGDAIVVSNVNANRIELEITR